MKKLALSLTKLTKVILLAGIYVIYPFYNNIANAQLVYQPYSYDIYQKFIRETYTENNDLHPSLKPFIFLNDSTLSCKYDSLITHQHITKSENWLSKTIFHKHLIEDQNSNYSFWLDFLPDFQVGREFVNNKKTYLNTRGYQLFGTIGRNFFFFSSGFENQASFANYENSYVNKVGIVPGQAYGRNNSFSTTDDWAYVTALIGYKAGNKLTFVLGEDKTFIGDGYRSVLLSDFASNYPLLRITYNLNKKVQYMTMWAYLQDQNALKLDTNIDYRNNRRKFGLFHYLDWSLSRKFSLGFFNALIAEEANDQGIYHGFDINYVNFILFTPYSGTPDHVKDHVLFGFNTHYKFFDKGLLYGQLLLDNDPSTLQRFKTCYQLGLKGWDFLNVHKLNYLLEYNTASPYTYSSQNQIMNYTHFAEPLAHPFGANFKELLGIMNYSIGKFDLRLQINLANYGLSVNNVKVIIVSNNLINNAANPASDQGLATSLKYSEATISYLINPSYNLRFELGALLREESNIQNTTKSTWLTFGLRSSFRNLYHDF